MTGRQAPREEAFADDYAVRHGQKPGYESGARFDAEQQPWRTSDFSREYIGARETPLRGQQFQHRGPEQMAAFEVERGHAREADVEVQAITRDEGREVIGWGPNPSQYDPQAIHKHEYDPEHQKPFYGANYARMFNDDVVPNRRLEGEVRQAWKNP